MVFLYRNEGASLSEVANSVDLTLPSVSKIIDALVTRKLVKRTASSEDRRYVQLKLSKMGLATLIQARHGTEASLAEKISSISPEKQAVITEAMQTLDAVFGPMKLSSGNRNR